MRRKFLYFKLFDLKDHPREVEILSALEVESLIGGVEPIDNIFQLSLLPEVNRIIEKDLNLQNALTESLPRRGRHGYLWIGEELPDVICALSRLAYVKEVFLFQQMLEAEPAFIKNPHKNITYLEYNINLWRVYKFWTFSYFTNRALYISSISKNENELDDKFRILREELNVLPGKVINKDPADMISFIQDNTLRNFNVDQRHATESNNDNMWLNALSNATSSKDGILLNSFCRNGFVTLEAILAGHNIIAQDINPVDFIMASVNNSMPNINLQEFNRLIKEIQSKIKMLMTASAATQTDLFLYSVEGQFLNFWETEKKRIRSLSLPASIEHIDKYIAATRFLIETKTITKSAELNHLFNVALVNLIALATRKKDKIEFYESYQTVLREVYLKLYTISKLQSFYSQSFGNADVFNTNCLSSFPEEKKISGVLTFLPSKISKTGFDKDRAIIAILNLHGAIEKLEHNLLGGRYISQKDKESNQEEINSHKGFYEQLPKEGHDVLSRLELMGRKDDVLRYYYLWKQYYRYLQLVSSKLTSGARICLLIENPVIKVDNTTTDLLFDDILIGIVENTAVGIESLNGFSKTVAIPKSTSKRVIKVLFFQKI